VAGGGDQDPVQTICVAAIAGAHGVRGAVRLKTFTEDPAAVGGFSRLADGQGRPVRLTVSEARPDRVIAHIEGVSDRDAARALKGTRLYVPRDSLPEADEDEYYHHDLIGLAVETLDGIALGAVKSVHDFGAGDIVEIEGEHAGIMLPFNRETVPHIDLAARRMVVDPPPGLPGLPGLDEDEENRDQ
jgi:16S rRNA processing protein RimM